MTSRNAKALLAVVLAMLAATGCGIKGPLTLPEKSENIVIRAPAGSAGTTPVPVGGAATTPSPGTAPVETTPTPAKPKPDRLPPPPLPSSNPGTGHGG